jgi:UDP-N-acetylmuramate dehydrogenase
MKMRSEAALLAIAHTPRALRDALRLTRGLRLPLYVLGGGSNTLFATSRFNGVVLKLGNAFQRFDLVEPDLLRVGAGLSLKNALNFSIECGLSGLEFGTGIPGTVGGAAAGNAGARDTHKKQRGMCDLIERLWCFDRTGDYHEIFRGEFLYAYRASELHEAIVIEMDLRLEQRSAEEIKQNLGHYRELRKGQPFGFPSCGCVFKNPIHPITGESIGAGKLIDELGLKGYRIGDAEISTKHANFMINRNRASGEDFLALITLTRDIVRQRIGIELDIEVEIVGGPLEHALL